MTSVSRKIHSRRRLAALTFLSNISLDGTHRDTNLGELTFNLKVTKSAEVANILVDHREILTNSKTKSVTIESELVTEKIKDSEIVKSTICIEKKLKRRGSECRDQENEGQLEDLQYPKNKVRVHKFVSEAKARLCNLSQRRKLSRQKSIESYGLSSANSLESLAIGSCRSRKASLCPSEISFPPCLEIKFVKSLKDHKNDSERIILISEKKSPFVLFSVLPYSKLQSTARIETKLENSRRRHTSMRQLAVINDGPDPLDLMCLIGVEKPLEGQDISYGELLAPSTLTKHSIFYDGWPETDINFRFPYQIHSSLHSMDFHIPRISPKFSSTPPKTSEKFSDKEDICPSWFACYTSAYHPNLLDDPELIAGKHSTLLVFPSYITSVIDYVKPSDLKKDLNDKFRERFPHVKLTLSKLRSLKREMYKIARHECNIDISVVAQAFVYFEKLILKILVNKQNRKHCAGACLLLSAKLNDVRGTDLRTLLEKIENIFRINRKDLISLEFGVLVALEFSLHISISEVLPHYQRLVYES